MCDRSQWAGIDGPVFANIMRALPFQDTVASEVVCRAWRDQLLHRSSPEMYCCGAILTDYTERIANPISYYRHPQLMKLPETPSDSFALGRWLSRRARGIPQLDLTIYKKQEWPGSSTAANSTERQLSFLDGLRHTAALALSVALRDTALPYLHSLQQLQCTRIYLSELLTAELWASFASFSHLTSLNLNSAPADLTLSAAGFSQLVHLSLSSHSTEALTTNALKVISELTRLTFLELASLGPWHDDDRPLVCQMPGCVTQLQHLHTLKVINVSIDNEHLSRLASLRSLHEGQGYGKTPGTLNLSGCSQLTHLNILSTQDTAVTIILPLGPYVRLQHLDADTKQPICNLKFATALTCLELQMCQVEQLAWPITLQLLERLVIDDPDGRIKYDLGQGLGPGLSDPLPFAWQSYSCLQCLSIAAFYTQTDLPEWLPDLKHLTELDLPRVISNDFLTGLLHLSGLERLSLVHAMIDWTTEMVDLACLPKLSYLDLGWWGYFEDEKKAWCTAGTQQERANLYALGKALKTRPLQLEKQVLKTWDGHIVPDIFWVFALPGVQPCVLRKPWNID